MRGGDCGQWSREQGSQGGEVHRIRLVILFTPVPWAKLVRGNQLSPALPSPSGTTPESFFKNLFVYLGHAGSLLLHMGFLFCREWGLLFIAVPGLLIAVASLVAEPGL